MRIIVVLAAILCLASCEKEQRVPQPDRLLSQDQMSDMLYDITLLSSAKNYNKRQFEQIGIMPEAFLYEKHGVDSLTYKQNSDYYLDNPELYLEIVTATKERMMLLQDTLKIQADAERAERKARQEAQDTLRTQKKPANLQKMEEMLGRNRNLNDIKMRQTPGIELDPDNIDTTATNQ